MRFSLEVIDHHDENIEIYFSNMASLWWLKVHNKLNCKQSKQSTIRYFRISFGVLSSPVLLLQLHNCFFSLAIMTNIAGVIKISMKLLKYSIKFLF